MKQHLTFQAKFLEESRLNLYTAATMRSIVSDVEDLVTGSLVDIGSGTGFLLDAVRAKAGRERAAYAVDINPSLLPRTDGVIGIVASGDSVPLPSGNAAMVMVHFVLSRVPRKVSEGIVQEMHRLLAPGGLFLAVEPCLGLATYHSARDASLGALMGIARRMKADHQLQVNDVDENVGLELMRLVRQVGLTPTIVDLHIARWFTAFPEWSSADLGWLRSRAESLASADGSAFLNSHTDRISPLSEGAGLVEERAGILTLTSAGLSYTQVGRSADAADCAERLLAGEEPIGPIDLIPVVRVVGRKLA
jgi:SAM-dependent methyltransferase